jgi:hypothetical protein
MECTFLCACKEWCRVYLHSNSLVQASTPNTTRCPSLIHKSLQVRFLSPSHRQSAVTLQVFGCFTMLHLYIYTDRRQRCYRCLFEMLIIPNRENSTLSGPKPPNPTQARVCPTSLLYESEKCETGYFSKYFVL